MSEENGTIKRSADHSPQCVARAGAGSSAPVSGDEACDPGPAIDTGFYYDFDAPQAFTAEDLEKIEAEMKKL